MANEVVARVMVGGEEQVWRRVSDLSAASALDRVFALDERPGAVRFGDGVHGQQPPDGAWVRVAYGAEPLDRDDALVVEFEHDSRVPVRRPTGPIRQIMPAPGWSVVLVAPHGEVAVPLVGWALVDPYVPVHRDGTEPVVRGEQRVRGLTTASGDGSVVLVDEDGPQFGGYRHP